MKTTVIERSHGRNLGRTLEAWIRVEAMEEYCFCLPLVAYLVCFLITVWDNCPGVAPAAVSFYNMSILEAFSQLRSPYAK